MLRGEYALRTGYCTLCGEVWHNNKRIRFAVILCSTTSILSVTKAVCSRIEFLIHFLMQSLNHLTEQNFSLVALQIIANDISELQKNQATTVAKIAQYKRKLMDLSHRVLQVPALFLFFFQGPQFFIQAEPRPLSCLHLLKLLSKSVMFITFPLSFPSVGAD